MVFAMQPLAENGILNGNVVWRGIFVIPVDREYFVHTPGKRHMIEDHIGAVGDARCIFTRVIGSAQSNTQVPANGVDGIGKGYPFTKEHNAITRRSLSGNGRVGGYNNIRCQVHDTAYAEYNYAARYTDGIAE